MAQLQREFPKFRIVRKCDSAVQRAIHVGLIAVTFGQMRAYVNAYQTTIGSTVYVTADWNDRPADQRYVTMRHEAVHIRQFQRFTVPGMAFLYLLIPLPLGLAYCRARFEWEAYRESIVAGAEVWGRAHVESGPYRDRIVEQFVGPTYGWMWPFRAAVERWYDAVLQDLP